MNPQKLPSISVVVPSYNQAGYIQRTIDSVLNQLYPAVEVIVMDGGSTDDTVHILNNYGKRIEYTSAKDGGQADAINTGLAQAKGDIVCYLNSDDELAPGSLKAVGEYFSTHPDKHWVSGDCQIINEQGEEIHWPIRLYKTVMFRLFGLKLLSIQNPIAQPSTFWTRTAYMKTGAFDHTLRYCMDYDYWMRLSKHYTLTRLPQILSRFRIHGQSKGGSQFREQFAEELFVAQRYTSSRLTLFFHKLHATLVTSVYSVIK